MTFHDFNLKVPVATVPEHKARLIRDGITRNEYRSRFGMDEASERMFARFEGNATFAAAVKKAPKPESKRGKLLEALQPGVYMTSRIAAAVLGVSHQSATNALTALKDEGLVVAEKEKGDVTLWRRADSGELPA
jgi:DNA-binding transcriptional ArsR family regulator